jgi:hypothetical protein
MVKTQETRVRGRRLQQYDTLALRHGVNEVQVQVEVFHPVKTLARMEVSSDLVTRRMQNVNHYVRLFHSSSISSLFELHNMNLLSSYYRESERRTIYSEPQSHFCSRTALYASILLFSLQNVLLKYRSAGNPRLVDLEHCRCACHMPYSTLCRDTNGRLSYSLWDLMARFFPHVS